MNRPKPALAGFLLSDCGRIMPMTDLGGIPGYVSEFADLKIDIKQTGQVALKRSENTGREDNFSCKFATGVPGVQIAIFAKENDDDLGVVVSPHPSEQDVFRGLTARRLYEGCGGQAVPFCRS